MLDNVIDINYYAVIKAKNSNNRHRPVGLGIMGFQDCLYESGVAYNSPAAVNFADTCMETVCYHAYWASTELAEERGAYNRFSRQFMGAGYFFRRIHCAFWPNRAAWPPKKAAN